MSARPTWQKLIERFDPEQPAKNPAWRADRAMGPAKAICERLDIPVGVPRFLLIGSVGTGKSTELYRIAEARASKELVVFIDLEHHFADVVGDAPALQHIASWEICFLMGVALLRATEERLSLADRHRRDLEDAWSKLAQECEVSDSIRKLDVILLAKSMAIFASAAMPGTGAPVGLTLLKSVPRAGTWTLPMGRSRKPLADQESSVRTLLGRVNAIIDLVQQRGPRVLFVIDGLDRIREHTRVRELFLDSQIISQLGCPMVVCGPYALRDRRIAAAICGFQDVIALVNEPVLQKSNPLTPGPGIDFFRALYARRVDDLPGREALISDTQICRLAYYSGGLAGEFVTFVRRVAQLSWLEDVLSATDGVVIRVLDERRRHRETGLHKGDLSVLEEVAREPAHLLPADPIAQNLLCHGTLLPFQNKSEWYFPHPLLLMHLLKV